MITERGQWLLFWVSKTAGEKFRTIFWVALENWKQRQTPLPWQKKKQKPGAMVSGSRTGPIRTPSPSFARGDEPTQRRAKRTPRAPGRRSFHPKDPVQINVWWVKVGRDIFGHIREGDMNLYD